MSSGSDDRRAGTGARQLHGGRVAGEIGGAFGDLGTFLPHVLGAITVAGLAPVGVLASFGVCYIATGLFYRLPIPVQPMKAVSAVLIASGLSAGEIAAAGLCLGVILLVLGATGAIGRFARIVPPSVVTGLQLGLGVTLALLSLELMAGLPWLGIVTAGLLLLLMRVPRCPATLLALGDGGGPGAACGRRRPLAGVRLGAGLAGGHCARSRRFPACTGQRRPAAVAADAHQCGDRHRRARP